MLKAKGLKSQPLIISGVGIIILLASHWLPYLIFLVPIVLMILLDVEPATNYKTIFKRSFYVALMFAIAFLLIGFLRDSLFISALIPALAAGIASAVYLVFGKYSTNKIGRLTFIIFWLSAQYLVLKSVPHFSPFFLSDLFHASHTSWTFYTGYLGVEVWILWVGFNLYNAFFRTEQIVIVSILFALIIFLIPIIIGLNLSENPVTKSEMLVLYSMDSNAPSAYRLTGEWMARTAAWLSVLLIVLTFVRFKTLKAK